MARLVEEGFLHDARGALEFRNELIRAQAYYAVAAPVRQHLHREVATVLARRAGAGPGVAGLEVAWHFLRAGDSTRALPFALAGARAALEVGDRKSTRLNSSHVENSYAVFCLKKKTG